MDMNLYKLVESILRCVGFIAIGGALALMFFFVFAPHILGARTIHKQLEHLQRQIEEVNKQLRQIAQLLKDGKDTDED